MSPIEVRYFNCLRRTLWQNRAARVVTVIEKMRRGRRRDPAGHQTSERDLAVTFPANKAKIRAGTARELMAHRAAKCVAARDELEAECLVLSEKYSPNYKMRTTIPAIHALLP